MFYQSQKCDTIRAFQLFFCFCTMYEKRGELPVSRKHDQPANNVGSTLRTMREERKITREKLSERAELGLRHVAAIELGEKNPSVDTLIRFVRSLAAPADRIFYPEIYSGDSDMELISRLSATCSSKQRKMIIAFIEMMLDHDEFE